MSYIGNQPFNTAYQIDTFSGNGSTSTFALSLAPASPSSILVTIGGILQDTSAYGVTGKILAFSGIPPTGANNISVRYLGLPSSNVTTTAYRTVTDLTATAGQTTFSTAGYTPSFIDVYRNGVKLSADDFVATNGAQVVLTVPAVAGDTIQTVSFYVSSVLNAIPGVTGAVSSTFLADASVTTAKVADSAITSAKIAPGAVLKVDMGANGTWAPAGTVVNTYFFESFASTVNDTATFSPTPLTITVTPTSTASRFVLWHSAWGQVSTNVTHGITTFYRNTTNLGGAYGFGNFYTASGGYTEFYIGITYVDSPATISPVTYTVYIRDEGSGSFTHGSSVRKSSFVIQEIAG
jgi:hypothetical protein